jgi:crossover junction endodeoxyribonuclease RuvC
VDYGVVRTTQEQPLSERLERIYRDLETLIDRHQPSVAAVEQLYFARNVKTAMVVAHGRAACILATARRHLELVEYTPLQIKQALTGHGRASKEQVQKMVRVLLGLSSIPRPDHAADALGAALCYVQSLAMNAKIARATAPATQTEVPENPLKVLLAQARRSRRHR